MSSHLRVYARLRFIRVRWINSPLATRRFQVRIVSSKTRPGFLLKTRSLRCWVKSCVALSVTFSGPICRAQQYRPKRLKTVRSAGFAPDLQRSSQASVRGTLRDLNVGDRSVRAGEFESAANVAFDIAPASR